MGRAVPTSTLTAKSRVSAAQHNLQSPPLPAGCREDVCEQLLSQHLQEPRGPRGPGRDPCYLQIAQNPGEGHEGAAA